MIKASELRKQRDNYLQQWLVEAEKKIKTAAEVGRDSLDLQLPSTFSKDDFVFVKKFLEKHEYKVGPQRSYHDYRESWDQVTVSW